MADQNYYSSNSREVARPGDVIPEDIVLLPKGLSRAGDSHRGAAAEHLNQKAAEGFITAEERDARVAHALAATTQAELAMLTSDLPPRTLTRAEVNRATRAGRQRSVVRQQIATSWIANAVFAMLGMILTAVLTDGPHGISAAGGAIMGTVGFLSVIWMILNGIWTDACWKKADSARDR